MPNFGILGRLVWPAASGQYFANKQTNKQNQKRLKNQLKINYEETNQPILTKVTYIERTL